jgi:hypothetical protein
VTDVAAGRAPSTPGLKDWKTGRLRVFYTRLPFTEV